MSPDRHGGSPTSRRRARTTLDQDRADRQISTNSFMVVGKIRPTEPIRAAMGRAIAAVTTIVIAIAISATGSLIQIIFDIVHRLSEQ